MSSLAHPSIPDPFAHWRWRAFLFILVLSFFTYAFNFANPPALFWDENYHIASAQKYLNHVFFMEPHPPLGKLLIAFGEKIIRANPVNNQFLDTDYAQNPPTGFSYVGYRLIPTLLGWWSAPLFFFLFLLITRRTLWSFGFSLLYTFDNALIVHSRAAMLDSTMIFFTLLTTLAGLLALEHQADARLLKRWSWVAGAAFGCVATTKLFGLVLVLLIPFLLWSLHHSQRRVHFLLHSLCAFLVVFCLVWWIHFALGGTIRPKLPDDGAYQLSAAGKQIVLQHKNVSPLAFPILLRDAIRFVPHYQQGVPTLNLCKKDENGSPWFFWPFGARTISYRWETPNGKDYRYLYLVANPVAWAAGLLGVVLASFLLLSRVLLKTSEKLRHGPLLLSFFSLYIFYMAVISHIDRVLYLYHYFLPLIFSFVLIAVVFDELTHLGQWALTEKRKNWIIVALAALLFLSFEFFHPFSYYELISDHSFMKRSLLKIWDLHCVHCEQTNPMLRATLD